MLAITFVPYCGFYFFHSQSTTLADNSVETINSRAGITTRLVQAPDGYMSISETIITGDGME